MGVDYAKLYKNLLEIEISNSCPKYRRGRPSKITFEKAFDGIRTFGYKKMNEKERDDLRAQLRKVKDARRGKQLVFFGDGTFSCTQKGHASIPKKKLIKQLAVRGLTFLLCERYTSLRCPCGSHELKNGEKVDGIRVRVHKTDGGVCSVLQSIQDRDEIACINMLLAASSACQGTQWPTHLTRTN